MDWKEEIKMVKWQTICLDSNQNIDRVPAWAKAERLGYCENAYQLKWADEKGEQKNKWVRRGIATALRTLAEAIYPQQVTEVVR